MNLKISFFPFLLLLSVMGHAQHVILQKGMRINKSVTVSNKTYRIDANEAGEQPVILIEGDNIVVDFANAVMMGSNKQKNPDEFFGNAIMVRNSKKVTIRNLKVRGYKLAFYASNVEELVLENCDFSYNYRQHLNSDQEREDLSDWMSYHHNEKDEWLRYGAAMYLRGCNKSIVRNCKVTGGQNALMMMECNEGSIYNNDFSFNSGIGIGLYHCSYNRFGFNRLVFNVRGYSDGVYNRGQDSAGILVYEQSNHNLFYRNNVTHGGDGFFLWAGQTTMDSGQGGCNDNIIRGNDFSYAPTNGIEVTFSRNYISQNRVFDCDNGIWGGYSYGTVISNNQFRNNHVGIAIEHGQQNSIAYNIFYKDRQAIRLWGSAGPAPDWGYAKSRDTRSRGYQIAFNNFSGNEGVMDISRTDTLAVFNNIYQDYGRLFKVDSTVKEMDTSYNEEVAASLAADTSVSIPIFDRPMNPFRNSGMLAGKKNIMMMEWGPYDFRSPIIWNTNPADSSGKLEFLLQGPAGKWKVVHYKGVDSVSAMSGEFPARMIAWKEAGRVTDIDIELEYIGAQVVTPMGVLVGKGKPYRFRFRKFFQPIDWTVSWYRLDTVAYNPLKSDNLFGPGGPGMPVKTARASRLDYAFWTGVKTDSGNIEQFITKAEGSAHFARGTYELSVSWDDAVRVYVDNRLVVDEWKPYLHQFDEAPNRRVRVELGGNHLFRVEHLNLGGFSVLSLKIRPVD